MPAIPAISPYPMPAAGDLPDNTAHWTLDPQRAVLLVHDMQHFFLRPLDDAKELRDTLVHNCRALRDRCSALGVPVVYSAQPGGMSDGERGLLRDFWGPGMTVAAEDRGIIDELAPRTGDLQLTKRRYSAFHRSGLLDRMRAEGRDQMIVCGVYAHVGVLMTCVDAFTHDIRVFLPADAVADFTPGYHRLALDYTAQRCGMVTLTRQVLAGLGRADSPVAVPEDVPA